MSLKVIILNLISLVLVSPFLSAQQAENRKSEEQNLLEDAFIQVKLLQSVGKRSEAIKKLDSLRKVHPNNSTLYMELFKLQLESKDINQAEMMLENAVKVEPNNIWVRRQEIEYYRPLQRKDKVIPAYQALITGQPKNMSIYDEYVDALVYFKDYESALKSIEGKEKKYGVNPDDYVKKALIYDKNNKPKEALSTIKKLIDQYPKNKKYYALAVSIMHSNDMIADSEPYLKKIIELDPNDSDAKLGLALLGKGKSKQDDFFVTMMPFISNVDVNIDAKIKELLPHVIRHAEKSDVTLGNNLIDLCDKLVNVHPNEAKSHAIFGDVLKNNHNYTAAARQYERTLEISKSNYNVWEQLMFCLDATKLYPQLKQTSNDAIDFHPNQAMSYVFLAKALTNEKQWKKAESYLSEAEIISAGNPEILHRLFAVRSDIFLQQGQYDKALVFIDQSLNISMNKSAEALELKGDIFLKKEDIKSALEYWKKALLLDSKNSELSKKIENNSKI